MRCSLSSLKSLKVLDTNTRISLFLCFRGFLFLPTYVRVMLSGSTVSTVNNHTWHSSRHSTNNNLCFRNMVCPHCDFDLWPPKSHRTQIFKISRSGVILVKIYKNIAEKQNFLYQCEISYYGVCLVAILVTILDFWRKFEKG